MAAFGAGEGFNAAVDGRLIELAPIPYVGWIAAGIGLLCELFDDIFGGSGSTPIPRQLRHRAHPIYTDKKKGNGISRDLIVTEASAAQASAPDTYSGEATYYYPAADGHTCCGYKYNNENDLVAAMPPNIVGPNGTYPIGTSAKVSYTPPGSKEAKTITV